jgi:peptidoglycan/LPS O-acetylase OafA/YrhL
LRNTPLSARHDPLIDALRAFAAAIVMGFHFFSVDPTPFIRLPFLTPLFTYGWLGIHIFFVISGYLLGGQLIDHRREPGAIKTFYIRRVARIMPLYLILLAMTAVAYPTAPTIDLVACLTMTQNFLWAFGTEPVALWLPPTWTIAVEEQFYLLLPALIFMVRPQKLTAILLAICVLSLLFHWGMQSLGYVRAADYLLPGIAAGFAVGVLLAQWVRQKPGLLRPIWIPKSVIWFGKRSYAIYLFHVPVADLVSRVFGRGLLGLALATIGTLVFSELLYLAVERPILNWARRRWHYAPTISPAAFEGA